MSDTKQGFYERIRILRRRAGLKQKEAAEAIGRDTGESWSRIERGLADSLTVDMLIAIARMCKENNVSLDWLFLGDEDIEQGRVIRKHRFNYIDVAADKKFAETATIDDIIPQLGRADRNIDIMKNLIRRNGDPVAKKQYIEAIYPNIERASDDRL